MPGDIFQQIVSQFIVECGRNGYSGVVYLHNIITNNVIVECSGQGALKLPVAHISPGKNSLISEDAPAISEPNTVSLEPDSQTIYPADVEIKTEDVAPLEDELEKAVAPVASSDNSEAFDMAAFLKHHAADGQTQASTGEDTARGNILDQTHHSSPSKHPVVADIPGTVASRHGRTNFFSTPSHTALPPAKSAETGAVLPRGRPYMFPSVSNNLSTGLFSSPPASRAPFICTLCNMSFDVAALYTRHMRRHTGEKPYRCGSCNKCFIAKGDLTRHMRVHTGEKPYQCKICNTSFSQSGSLQIHKRLHSRERPYHCVSCDIRFCRATNYRKHMKSHALEMKPHRCPKCPAVFAIADELKVHRKAHPPAKAYCCEVCTKLFASRSELVRHMRIHTEAAVSPKKTDNCSIVRDDSMPDVCEEINTKSADAHSKTRTKHDFLQNNSLDADEDSHVSLLLKDFPPPAAPSSSSSLSTDILTQNTPHQRSTTVSAPLSSLLPLTGRRDYQAWNQLQGRAYCCALCNKSFTTKGDLTRHMRVHTDNLTQLTLHQRSPAVSAPHSSLYPASALPSFKSLNHPPDRAYCCALCDMRFTRRGNLKRHMRVHTGEKPYICKKCNASFSQSHHLQAHWRLYSQEKLYFCKICNLKFCGIVNYNKHMKHHSVGG